MKRILIGINSQYIHTNLAIRCIDAYASAHGCESELAEFSVNEQEQGVIRRLFDKKADLYAFSCYIWNISYVKHVASVLKKMLPDCKILLGGPEVSWCADEILDTCPYVDYVIVGEGEKAYVTIDKNTARGSIQGEKLPMEEYPFAYRNGLPENYRNRILYYESSRGCPFACGYCLSSAEKGVRYLPIERAKRELSYFIENEVPLVKLVDRTFNSDKERARELWRYLIANKGKTEFHFEIAGDLLEEEDLQILAEAPKGLFRIEAGVQSTNREVLHAVGRYTEPEKLNERLRQTARLKNVPLHTDLIAGLPGESYESFLNSFDDAFALGSECLQLGFLKLLKGTRLRAEAESFGCVFDEREPYEVIRTDAISTEELARLHDMDWANERLVNSGNFPTVTELALTAFEKPSEMLLAFHDEANGAGLTEAPYTRARWYEVIYQFLCRYGKQELASDVIKYDFLRSGSKKGVPGCLNLREEEKESARLSREMKKKITVQRFSFDTKIWREEKRIVPGESYEAYDASTERYRFLFDEEIEK